MTTLLGYCADCDSTRLLTRAGRCDKCGSDGIMQRAGQRAGQRISPAAEVRGLEQMASLPSPEQAKVEMKKERRR